MITEYMATPSFSYDGYGSTVQDGYDILIIEDGNEIGSISMDIVQARRQRWMLYKINLAIQELVPEEDYYERRIESLLADQSRLMGILMAVDKSGNTDPYKRVITFDELRKIREGR